MELKMKDYEKFKAYYCGLCRSIKNNAGNIPRVLLNYDMTFLAILLDSFDESKSVYARCRCIVHPFHKRVFLLDNDALKYAAYFNIILSYHKLADNYNDERSAKSKILLKVLAPYMRRFPESTLAMENEIKKRLNELSAIEASQNEMNIDEISHPFADLTGYVLSSYNEREKEALYWLGYNLGKWIYIIDAFDDLEKDMKNGRFNAIEAAFGRKNQEYGELKEEISGRVDFVLTASARQCVVCLDELHLNKNSELLHNILQYGLMEKMDKVFKRSCKENEESI